MADDQQRGDQGPRGAEGAAGARGAEGAAGARGAVGAEGGRGVEGTTGTRGETGPIGTGTTQITFISRGAKVALILSWLAMAGLFVWLLFTSATVSSLDKTDKIACQFLRADALIRNQQVDTTRASTLVAERDFIRDADAFLSLFGAAEKKSKNPGGLVLFESYIRAERALVTSQRDGTLQNTTLLKTLASIGQKLANQLHC